MRTRTTRPAGVAVARAAVSRLCGALGLPVPEPARPGAVGLLAPAVLLRAADGWVHPGPPTAWIDFTAMVATLGAPPTASARAGGLPDVSMLAAELVDREAGEWRLPAVAVRATPATAPRVGWPTGPTRLDGARVVVLGSAWAAPLTGLVLAQLGGDVVRVTHPRRHDPFPLRDALRHGQREVPLDLDDPRDRVRFADLVDRADVLVDGTTPRVLRNVGLDDPPRTAIVRISAFGDGERPGYGSAAEARGGWASRHDPPRLGRSSVADPVAGLLAALLALDVLARRGPPARERVSLEDAVGHLLELERGRA